MKHQWVGCGGVRQVGEGSQKSNIKSTATVSTWEGGVERASAFSHPKGKELGYFSRNFHFPLIKGFPGGNYFLVLLVCSLPAMGAAARKVPKQRVAVAFSEKSTAGVDRAQCLLYLFRKRVYTQKYSNCTHALRMQCSGYVLLCNMLKLLA